MKYIKKFASKAEFDAYKASSDYCEPHVSKVAGEMCINSYNDKVWRWARMPLTFEILDAVPNGSNIDTTSGNSYYTALGTPDGEGGFVLPGIDLWYSLNGGPWTQYGAEYIAAHPSGGYWYQGIPVKTGDIIQFKGDNPTVDYPVFSYGQEFHFGTRGVSTLKIYGNVASIIDSTNYASITEYDAGIPDYFTNKGYGSSGYYFFDCGYHYDNPNACDCTHLIYPKNPYLSTPITFEIDTNTEWYLTDGEGVSINGTVSNMYYKVNSGEWTQYTGIVNSSAGDVIQIKGDQNVNDEWKYLHMDNITTISGNPLSVLDSTTFSEWTDFRDEYEYDYLNQFFTRCNGYSLNNLMRYRYKNPGGFPVDIYHVMVPFDYGKYILDVN